MDSKRSFDKLEIAFLNYLEKIGYSNTTINHYRGYLNDIRSFLKKNGLSIYTSDESSAYLNFLLDGGDYCSMTRRKKDKFRVANALLEYDLNGVICYRTTLKKSHNKKQFEEVIHAFEQYRLSKGISKRTLKDQAIYLDRLQTFLETNEVESFKSIQNHHILDYIKTLAYYSAATMHCNLSHLRIFLRFLNETDNHEKDLSYLIPKSGYKQQAKIPTTYTPDEIKKMIDVIDRGSSKGKRDYAMVLLCARLGLRASDVCQLRFNEINWQKSQICLTQKKTHNHVELPMLPEVGNAIIDYLKYGRPKSDSPFIFLDLGHRNSPLQSPTLHSIVKSYLSEAGIKNLESKKTGPHALRHSLASQLLENKSPLPVISEILGHESSETTKEYLRIDIVALRQCALEVPDVPNDYYIMMEMAR